MTKETTLLTQDEALDRVERDRAIDGFFAALSKGEQPKAEDLDAAYLKEVLADAGADLDTSDFVEAKESLKMTKYTEKHPDRRLGCEIVWDYDEQDVVVGYERWAQVKSEMTCPRFKNDKKEPIEGSQSRGLKQLLADLTEMAIGGGMTVEDFVRRTDIRVRRGLARKNKTEMPESDLAMIPAGSLEAFWNAIRSGGLPH